MLSGRMMDFPLTITHLIERARVQFPETELVDLLADKTHARITYGEWTKRVARLANALTGKLGVKGGDRVATLAFNHSRHLDGYFAIPSVGAVIHTLNLRLSGKELGYIAHHAEDTVLFVDEGLLPLYDQFKASVPSIKKVIVYRTLPRAANAAPLPDGMLDYDELLNGQPDTYAWPELDERSASMLCYTSGTTGNPKGVLYSHRSIALHALALMGKDAFGMGAADCVLPVVPMFHASAWGLPYVAVTAGAKMVFNGNAFDAISLLDLMESEKVTFAGGVPTIWIGILNALDSEPKRWKLVVREMAVGGSAAPPALIAGFDKHGLGVLHAWGMTETNPVGTMGRVKPSLAGGSAADTLALRATQGYPLAFIETRHTDENGKVLAWDGETMGELEVRGAWVASSYYGDEGKDRFTADGWFKTGDVVTIDKHGYVRITDRSKDVVKSGGEWISSVQLENELMSHPAVLEAAVFAARHAKWDERPVAAVVLKPNQTTTEGDLAKHLDGKFAKYWMPDRFLFVEAIPRTSTGKFLKTRLRELYGEILMK